MLEWEIIARAEVKELCRKYLSPARSNNLKGTTYGTKHIFESFPGRKNNLYVDVNTFNEIMEELGFKLLKTWPTRYGYSNNEYAAKWNRDALKRDGYKKMPHEERIIKVK